MSVGFFSSEDAAADKSAPTQFPANSQSSGLNFSPGQIPAAILATAISIASVRAARSADPAESREALAEVDSLLSQVER